MFWLSLRVHYEIRVVEERAGAEIERVRRRLAITSR
jgi:hypothetical protein